MSRPQRAFTLLEVVLALTLLIFLLGVLFRFYGNSMDHRQRGVSSIAEAHQARALLKQITEEIRASAAFAPGFGPGLVGDRYEMTVQTTYVPSKELFKRRSIRQKALPAQHDIKQVRYFIAWDEEITDDEGIPLSLGLVRQQRTTMRQSFVIIDDLSEREFEDVNEEAEQSFRLQLYAPEIKYLEFRYYDGAEWHKDWKITQGNSLPQMVRVTIGYDTQVPEDLDEGFDDELFEFEEDEIFPPRSYTAYVRLLQADTFFGSRITRAAADLAEGGI